MPRFGIRLLLLAALMVLLLCPAARAETRLTLWTSEIEETRIATIRYLLDVFMLLHDDIKVEVASVDENDFVPRLTQAEVDKHGPSLINTGCDLLTACAEKGFLNTNATGQFINRLGADRFYGGALKLLTAPDGRTRYGTPFHGWVQSIWYRADLFADAGLPPPETWDNLLTAARHFNDPDRGFYGILMGTDTDQYAEQIFTQIALANNARMFDRNGKLAFNSPGMVEALEFYLKLAENTPPGPQTWRGRDYYIQGKMAMMFYSSFIMDDLALAGTAENSLGADNFPELGDADFNPELARNTRPVSLLTRMSPSGYGIINGFGIMKNTTPDQLSAVLELLDFLYQPNQYIEWMHMAPGGMLPVLRDIAETEFFMRDPKGVFRKYGRPSIRKLLAGLEEIRTFGLSNGKRCPHASIFYAEKIIPRMIVKARSGEMTPEQAVTWAEGEMRRVAAKHGRH